MPPLKKAFEDGTLWLGPSDDHVTDLRIVRELRGVPRVPPVRTGEKGLKRHGDYAIGLALAHFASRMRWVQYDYRAVSAPTSAGSAPDDDGAPRPWYRQPLGAGLRGGI